MRLALKLTLLFVCGMVSLASAQEPLLRVIDLKSAQGQAVSLEHRKPQDPQWYQAYVGTTATLHDRFKTGPATLAALEFFIGGRVSVSRDTEIEVVSERSISSSAPSLKRIILVNGYLWFKGAKLAQPLEIQTNGGTMAIKGTEFTLESNREGSTVSVLEGSVEVNGIDQKFLAKPGDICRVSDQGPSQLTQMDPQELRKLREQGPLGEMAVLWQEFYSLDLSRARRLSDQLQEALERLENRQRPEIQLSTPFRQASSRTLGLSSKGVWPKEPLRGLNVLTWEPVSQADGYVVLVAGDSDFKDMVFSLRSRDSQVVYPGSARPLRPGRYHWRVVPVDAQDEPLPGAFQAQFTIQP